MGRRGLEYSGRFGRIVVDPRNPDVVMMAALGHSYGPQQERGVYRTTDGGKSWKRVLFVDENTGAADIVMDPNDPDILFAAMWQIAGDETFLQRLLSCSSAVEYSKLVRIELFGFGLASLGLPQGIVKPRDVVA
jgi:hypothetical protein